MKLVLKGQMLHRVGMMLLVLFVGLTAVLSSSANATVGPNSLWGKSKIQGIVSGFYGGIIKPSPQIVVSNGTQQWTVQADPTFGTFSLEVPAGTYQVTVTADDYETYTKSGITVKNNLATSLIVNMVYAYGQVTGKVSGEKGQALKDAIVSIPSLGLQTKTGGLGVYTLAKLKPGRYEIHYAYGSLKTTKTITVVKNEIAWANVELTAPKDKKAPETSYTLAPLHPSDGTRTTTLVVTLTATDDLSGVAFTQYRINSKGEWMTYSEPFPIAAATTRKVEFRSKDNAGNLERAQELDFSAGCGCKLK